MVGCGVASRFPSLYQIESRVRGACATALPGSAAHLLLAPRPRFGWHPGDIPAGARRAAALVLLYAIDDDPHLVLTVRSGNLAAHASQVSLPGGAIEPHETVTEAALRETFEEVGLDPGNVAIQGELSALFIPASGFVLHPVVGTTTGAPSFRRCLTEVDRILQIRLATLGLSSGPHRGYRWWGRERVEVPYFEVAGERVWGATAMVLAEMLTVIGTPPVDPWSPGRGPVPTSAVS